MLIRRYSCYLRESHSQRLSSPSSPTPDCHSCTANGGINGSSPHNATCFVAADRFRCVPVTLTNGGGDQCSSLLCPSGMGCRVEDSVATCVGTEPRLESEQEDGKEKKDERLSTIALG